MIRLDNISKQNGHHLLFIEASAALQRGEKVGLVGPNGSGKTTLFRMITGEELPDEGQVATDRGITIGYFSQDVGEMAGRSAVSEVMDGAGPVAAVAAELKELETAMADAARADETEEIIARYETSTGRDLSRIAFYETFARFKVAVVIQQIYFRYVQGQTHDERFRNFDGLVRELANEALDLAEHSGI